MADVVGMGLPIGLHLREKVGFEYALHLGDGALNRVLLLRINVGIAGAVEIIQTGCDPVHRVRRGFVLLAENFDGFALEIR